MGREGAEYADGCEEEEDGEDLQQEKKAKGFFDAGNEECTPSRRRFCSVRLQREPRRKTKRQTAPMELIKQNRGGGIL